MFGQDFKNRLLALLYVVETEPDGTGLVRFFADGPGAVVAKARGLCKPASKLAPHLVASDELQIELVPGRGRTPILAGISVKKSHALWRSGLDHQALLWFMVEFAYISSGEEQENRQMFRLTANILRQDPDADQLAAAASAFCLKALAIHGMLPDLHACAVTADRLPGGEPVFMLPSREGLVSLETYNSKYARTGRGFIKLDPHRIDRWRRLSAGPLLGYPSLGFDELDAAVLISLAGHAVADVAGRHVKSTDFLVNQWKLRSLAEISREQAG